MDNLKFLDGRVAVNVLAKTPQNAKDVQDAAEGYAIIGVVSKDFPTVQLAVDTIRSLRNHAERISIGLGGGDSAQWEKVIHISAQVRPNHINQVFPLAGYTQAYMRALGQSPLVNALISPTGIPGRVRISTGPLSGQCPNADIEVVTALSMIREAGIRSVKLFPIRGDNLLDEVSIVARTAAQVGIEVFEPTGGIDESNFGRVLEICLRSGVKRVIPHVYSSIVDKATGLTRPESVANLLSTMKQVAGRF